MAKVFYALFLLSAEMVVLAFFTAFNIGRIEDRNRRNLLQLVFAAVAAFGVLAGLVLAQNKAYRKETRLAEFEFWRIALIMALMVLFGSVYKYRAERHGQKEVEFQLKASQYEIRKETSPAVGNLPYPLAVKQYIIYEDKIIIFTTLSLEKAIDGVFVCRELGKNVYECEMVMSNERRSVFGLILTGVIIVSAVLFPIACVLVASGIAVDAGTGDEYIRYIFWRCGVETAL